MGINNVTDLDFDELDRAVNSLIASAPQTPASDEDKEKVLTLSETDEVPASLPVSTSASAVTTPEITPVTTRSAAPAQPLAARRSSGRFMDVVHPSSDMRSAPSNSGFTTPRPTISLKPTGANVTPEPFKEKTPEPKAPTTIEDSAAPSHENDWPDPLDFNALSQEHEDTSPTVAAPVVAPVIPPIPEIEDESDDDDIDQIANAIDDSMKNGSEQALDSPFLPDAKVNKRPLGAFSDEAASADAITSPITAVPVTSPSTSLLESPSFTAPITSVKTAPAPSSAKPFGTPEAHLDTPVIEPPIPEELRSDLLSIESGNMPESTDALLPITPGEVTPARDDTPTGPTAITQQYKEEPSTGDQQSGSIFDTKSYHKPLAHPAKKKSGWGWIPWIFIFIVLGGGVGLGVYYFVLPMLQ